MEKIVKELEKQRQDKFFSYHTMYTLTKSVLEIQLLYHIYNFTLYFKQA